LPPDDLPEGAVIPEPVMGRAGNEATARQVLEDQLSKGGLRDLIAQKIQALVMSRPDCQQLAENVRAQAREQEGASPQ
jgi:hypothetical protein